MRVRGPRYIMLYHIEDADEYTHRVWVVGLVSWDAPFDSAPRGSTEHYAAVVDYIREHHIKHCGSCHQRLPEGALRFSDGLMWAEKMSHWAIAMSEAWDDEPNSGCHYLYSCEQCRPTSSNTRSAAT